jgi:hypothetical protein
MLGIRATQGTTLRRIRPDRFEYDGDPLCDVPSRNGGHALPMCVGAGTDLPVTDDHAQARRSVLKVSDPMLGRVMPNQAPPSGTSQRNPATGPRRRRARDRRMPPISAAKPGPRSARRREVAELEPTSII